MNISGASLQFISFYSITRNDAVSLQVIGSQSSLSQLQEQQIHERRELSTVHEEDHQNQGCDNQNDYKKSQNKQLKRKKRKIRQKAGSGGSETTQKDKEETKENSSYDGDDEVCIDVINFSHFRTYIN